MIKGGSERGIESDGKQRLMLRFCIAMVSILVIVASAGRYFSDVVDLAEVTEAQAAIASYTSSVVTVHHNWLMQGKTKRVEVTSLDERGKPGGPWFFVVNKQGWPINIVDDGEKPDCTALWFALQKNQRLDFTGQAIKMMADDFGRLTQIKEVSFATRKQITWVCQNLVAQQLLFRYRLDTGKVDLL